MTRKIFPKNILMVMIPQMIPFLIAIMHLTIMGTAANLPGKITRYVPVKLVENPRMRYWYGNESHTRPPDGREFQKRFIDVRDGYEEELPRKMAKQGSTTTESSFYDYFLGKDDSSSSKDDDEDDDEDDDDEEKDDDDDDDDYDDIKKEDKKKDPFVRGVRRKHVKAHKLVFPLLMAYKLKFFTMLPLLVGSLVLLIGTTGIAGFFFALFSAALGLHVKPHYH